MAQYATAAELAAYTGKTAPPDADRLLQRASDLVDSKVTAPYAVTFPAGVRTVAEPYRSALRDAVCAQVEWWTEMGDEAGALLAFESIGAGLNASSSGRRLAPRAEDHLRVAGLLQGVGVA